MKCYACDILLESPALDKPTGRFYCSECMEPTNQVILAKIEQELEEEDFALLMLDFEDDFEFLTDVTEDDDDTEVADSEDI